jgi:hypothetical protein
MKKSGGADPISGGSQKTYCPPNHTLNEGKKLIIEETGK